MNARFSPHGPTTATTLGDVVGNVIIVGRKSRLSRVLVVTAPRVGGAGHSG